MRLLVSAICLLALAASAVYAEPHKTYGDPGTWQGSGHSRQDYCQWGFNDESVGWGYTLGLGQQLGIECIGPMCIDEVGFYVEFLVTGGAVNITIYDNGVLEHTETVYPAAGENNFVLSAPVDISGTACIMLCPDNNYWSVCGEDFTNAFPNHSFFSSNCTCQSLFTDNNQTIWAHLCGVVPTETQTWGTLRALYR